MKKLIYVGDPMCSWCYGFAPEIARIADKYEDRVEISLWLGGLYTGGKTFQTPERITFLRQTWPRIAELSGQPFDYSILDTEGWLYDTELSCRAIVAMRRLKPSLSLECFHAVQKSFYVSGQDMQSIATFTTIAEELGLDGEAFDKELLSEECIEETRRDFLTAKQMGVTGFPTVLLNDDDGWALLSAGYQKFEVLEPVLDSWLGGD